MPNFEVGYIDQAHSIRQKKRSHKVRVLTVSAGKGGVGKSSISVNLALSLQKQGNRVAIFDGDLGLANIDVMLGVYASKTIENVILGECHLNDTLIEGPEGIKIIPSVSGIEGMANLSKQQHAGIVDAFNELSCEIDYLIIDTAAGISDSVLSFIRSSQEVLIVVRDEPTSITDAYALIKIMHRRYAFNRFNILANFARSSEDGAQLFRKLCRVSDKFLDVSLTYLGDIPNDGLLAQALRVQKPVVMQYPDAKSTKAFRLLADKIDTLSWPNLINSNTGFFFQRAVSE